ncbi:MAG: DoxX family protein [Deltaproteobacteria bacterium]|nr:DoxX family protein [Deltaproteobacteria bacterium]MBW2071569.1 DoxX family protein [Deltaproteobacteria bacterium]
MSISNWLYKLCRWVLAGVFIYAGFSKLVEPGAFAALLEAYGVVPASLLLPVAIFLPALEVAAGLGLVFDIEGSLALIAGLLGLFVSMLIYAIWIGLDVDCGCFGSEELTAAALHSLRPALYRDLFMLADVVFLYVWRRCTATRPVEARQLVDKLLNKRRTKDAYV